MRLLLALRAFLAVLTGRPVPAAALPAPAADPRADRATLAAVDEGALRLLTILQREGRLVDFLTEDIDGFDDAQVGAAARAIHRGCRTALRELFDLRGVRDEDEGTSVTLAPGFDPWRVTVTGRAPSPDAPVRGALLHRGWYAARVTLPSHPAGRDARIVAAAEVEVP